MQTITGGGVFSYRNISDINANFSQLSSLILGGGGNLIWCNPATGVDAGADGSQAKPYGTIGAAYGKGRSGYNDVILLVGNGAASGSARLSATMTWAKNALHLVGVCPPALSSQRARIAPTSGATAFANFFVVSGSGCYFSNLEFFQGFTAGVAAEICMNVTGSYNVFQNCHFAGMGDTDGAAGADTGSRNLKVGSGGSGENLFQDCVIGLDTVARSVANASLELAGNTPRNVFRRCDFYTYATNNGVLTILGTGAACVDRVTIFEDCGFYNSIKSGSGTAQAVLGSFTNAAPGGLVVFKRAMSVGATVFGDTNFLANSYIDMAAVSASAGGLGVHPS